MDVRGLLKNALGFGLVEGIIGAGILAVAILAISNLIIQSTQNTVGLEGAPLCQTRAQMIVRTFKNADNKTAISNWVYSGGSLLPTLTSPFHNEIAMYNILFNTGMGSGIVPITSADLTNGWELIDNGTNRALSLVKASNAFCVLPTAPVPNPVGQQIIPTAALDPVNHPSYSIYDTGLAPPASSLIQEKDFINIQLIDNSTSVLTCPGAATRIVPLSPNSLAGTNTGTSSAVQITGSVQYTDLTGTSRTCQSTTKVKPDGDNSPPQFINPTSLPSPVMTIAQANYCGTSAANSMMCVQGLGPKTLTSTTTGVTGVIACDTESVKVAFAVSEPGTVFGCYLDYNPVESSLAAAVNTSKLFLCGQGSYTLGGNTVNMSVAPYLGSSANGSGAVVLIGQPGQLVDGFYRLWVRAFDSAQNFTDQSIDFGVDLTRPNVTAIKYPKPLMDYFQTSASARSHLAVAAPYKSAISYSVPNQCEDSQPGDIWTSSNTEPVPVAPAGAVWSLNGAPLSGGTCTSLLPSPQGLTSQAYTMTATGCDACGPGTGNASQNFEVNVIPAGPISSWHSPTALFPATFGTVAAPTLFWQVGLSPADPESALNVQFACPNVLPLGQFASAVTYIGCAPSPTEYGLVTGACSSQGSTGFSIRAFDGCGRFHDDANTPYQIAAKLGENCCNVSCRNDQSLTCAMDNSIYRGTCVTTKSCVLDSDCGGNGTCYLATNTCYGGATGPAPQTCLSAAVTPTPTPVPSTPTPTPVPTPTPGPGGLVPSNYGFLQGNTLQQGVPYSKTFAVTLPSPAAPGDLLVFAVGWSDWPTNVLSVNDNVGDAFVSAIGPLNWAGPPYPFTYREQLFYASNISGGTTTVTVNLSAIPSKFYEIRVYEFSGVITTSPLDVTVSSNGSSTIPYTFTSPTLTPNYPNELVFAFAQIANISGDWPIPGPTLQLLPVTAAGGFFAAEGTIATPGPFQATGTSVAPNGYEPWNFYLATFRTQ